MDVVGVAQPEGARVAAEAEETCFVSIWTAGGPLISKTAAASFALVADGGSVQGLAAFIVVVRTESDWLMRASQLLPHNCIPRKM